MNHMVCCIHCRKRITAQGLNGHYLYHHEKPLAGPFPYMTRKFDVILTRTPDSSTDS